MTGVEARKAAQNVRYALGLVRYARDLLKSSGAMKAATRVASVVHSVEGAARHAELRHSHTEEPCTCCWHYDHFGADCRRCVSCGDD